MNVADVTRIPSDRSQRTLSVFSVLALFATIVFSGSSRGVYAKPQIMIECDPAGSGYQQFHLYWSSTGNINWPNYIYTDLYDSNGTEISGYPQEDATIYYVPANDLGNPNWISAQESDSPAVPGGTIVISVVGEWNDATCGPCAAAAACASPDATTRRSQVRRASKDPTGLQKEVMRPLKIRYRNKRPVPNKPRQFDVELELMTIGWRPDTEYVAGTTVTPNPTDGSRYKCTAAGKSGGAAPNWGAATVKDGTAKWSRISPVADLRFVYALVKMTDPDNSLIVPLKETDTAGNQHIFRRVRHAGSTKYSISPSAEDNPYVLKDIRVDLNGTDPTEYVYLIVFVVDLTKDDQMPVPANGKPKQGTAWPLPRLQVQP